ncbi:hypothetical protein EYF80_005197 [Liparis tanakae]|uniref:Uncharacterized protein n=1 Tax=Liparis tanakae TaxID=230148 RepID=A0A4Z2J3B4_9TELE|nr:hypothetical protein EYF80_005197 [Liparis tanakae]
MQPRTIRTSRAVPELYAPPPCHSPPAVQDHVAAGTLNHQPTGVTPTGRAEASRFLPRMTSDTPSLCLVALKRQWWGFSPAKQRVPSPPDGGVTLIR